MASVLSHLMIPPTGNGYDPQISPVWNVLPFLDELADLVGSTVAIVLLCLVGSTVFSAFVWAGGKHWDHGRAEMAGKSGVVISLIASFLVGGGSAAVKWFATLGSGAF